MTSASHPTQYHDNWLDRAFIWLFSRKMAKALGTPSPTPTGYDGFVALSQQIMRGRTPQQQQQVVAVVLQSLVPAPILWLIRTLFSPTRWVCESNAWFATKLFEWLVGPCDLKTVELTTPSGQTLQQASGVHIQKCRYLEQSGCVGMCVNMCKLPTQTFFTEKFGIPLTMTPNFDDLSCDMVFGQLPPPIETEAAYHQPCLAPTPTATPCPTATPIAPACPKLRT